MCLFVLTNASLTCFFFVWRFSPNPSDPDFNQPAIRYFRHLDILFNILGSMLRSISNSIFYFLLLFSFLFIFCRTLIFLIFWSMFGLWVFERNRYFVFDNTENTQGARPTTKGWSDLHNIRGVKEQSIPRTSDVINCFNILISNHPTVQISKYVHIVSQ